MAQEALTPEQEDAAAGIADLARQLSKDFKMQYVYGVNSNYQALEIVMTNVNNFLDRSIQEGRTQLRICIGNKKILIPIPKNEKALSEAREQAMMDLERQENEDFWEAAKKPQPKSAVPVSGRHYRCAK